MVPLLMRVFSLRFHARRALRNLYRFWLNATNQRLSSIISVAQQPLLSYREAIESCPFGTWNPHPSAIEVGLSNGTFSILIVPQSKLQVGASPTSLPRNYVPAG
jgi:hypothetical protein